MGCLQIILIDYVVDAFAFMLTDVLRVRILQFLVMLNCEILPLDIFLEFFSLLMTFG